MKKIIIIAGDKSGDIYGGLLAEKIKLKTDNIEIISFGGENLARTTNQKINLTSIAVSGITEVFSQIKNIFKIFYKCLGVIKAEKPDLIILIDFPDFNLRLAKKLKKQFPVFYYVSPQIWAWRKSRINIIKKYIDNMIVLFKFEKDFYARNNMEVLYFGHPLLEIIPVIDCNEKNIISLMPGSRKNEIEKHLPIMLQTYTLLKDKLPDYKFRIIRPENINIGYYDKFQTNLAIETHSYEKLKESKFIIVCSGTATVELAILNTPFLIIYKASSLSWFIARLLVNLDFAGMVNILAKKEIVPELLQNNATPEKIAEKTLEYLQCSNKIKDMKTNLSKIRNICLPENATEKFSMFIIDFLENSRKS
ncbi:MAG: lipid-A-disaccharide synthase [Candidatus Omnitrophica bacterium]|nr:lipid-A-disaccharide synthase [Candidatus Omnitrophota bacterium]MDD5080826.1 lipid-A-disaccharide synthase [Candidatus Omnitrophota bacterium]